MMRVVVVPHGKFGFGDLVQTCRFKDESYVGALDNAHWHQVTAVHKRGQKDWVPVDDRIPRRCVGQTFVKFILRHCWYPNQTFEVPAEDFDKICAKIRDEGGSVEKLEEYHRYPQ